MSGLESILGKNMSGEGREAEHKQVAQEEQDKLENLRKEVAQKAEVQNERRLLTETERRELIANISSDVRPLVAGVNFNGCNCYAYDGGRRVTMAWSEQAVFVTLSRAANGTYELADPQSADSVTRRADALVYDRGNLADLAVALNVGRGNNPVAGSQRVEGNVYVIPILQNGREVSRLTLERDPRAFAGIGARASIMRIGGAETGCTVQQYGGILQGTRRVTADAVLTMLRALRVIAD